VNEALYILLKKKFTPNVLSAIRDPAGRSAQDEIAVQQCDWFK
jgi:hypothetical protein